MVVFLSWWSQEVDVQERAASVFLCIWWFWEEREKISSEDREVGGSWKESCCTGESSYRKNVCVCVCVWWFCEEREKISSEDREVGGGLEES